MKSNDIDDRLFKKPNKNTVTEEIIKSKILREYYNVMPDGKTTICCLIMENGYTIIGTSSCVDPENYDKLLGERYAYENAFDKAWELEGYVLAQKIYEDKNKQPISELLTPPLENLPTKREKGLFDKDIGQILKC